MAVALVVSHPIKNKVGAVDHWDRTTVAVFFHSRGLAFFTGYYNIGGVRRYF